MKIALNLLYLIPGKVGGSERFVRSIIDGLQKLDSSNHYYLILNRESEDTFQIFNPNFQVVNTKVRASKKLLRIVFESSLLQAKLLLKNFDCQISFGTIHPFVALSRHNIINIYDLIYLRRPENYSFATVKFVSFNIRSILKCTDYVFTLSNFSRNDISKEFSYNPDKIKVIPCAADNVFFKKVEPAVSENLLNRLKINKPYILTVCNYYPHKNLKFLANVFLKHFQSQLSLVIVGIKTKDNDVIPAENDNVILPGRLTESELSALYQNAAMFVIPSLYEGFGIPPLEAMASGIPVISSDRTSLPEVCGDAALYFNPLDEQDLEKKIRMIIENDDLKQSLIEKGKARAVSFDWDISAKYYLECINSLV